MDEHSLVATRARRANAGSRLKLLIEMEEQATGVQSMIYTEDDENVQLLFQEDENDEEFEEPDSGDENEEGENSQAEEGQDEENTQLDSDNNGSETEVAINSDEMLSDSDLSVSEDDESEGERELVKEERAKKRKHRQKTIIPAIKKPKVATTKPPPKPKVTHSELLLKSERRASSRKSALQNKQELVEKLKEDETRRAALTPVVRVKERELTQEERLAEAKETEKHNIISLNTFLQQEIVKKERQKLMFQQKRPKIRNVIRLYSAETFVTPLDEIEDARYVQDLFERKKRGRRRKNQSDEPDVKRPGDIDTELPYYKKEMEEKRRIEAERAEERRKLEEARAAKRKKLEEERAERKRLLEEERLARKKAKEARLKEFGEVDIYNDPNKIKSPESDKEDPIDVDQEDAHTEPGKELQEDAHAEPGKEDEEVSKSEENTISEVEDVERQILKDSEVDKENDAKDPEGQALDSTDGDISTVPVASVEPAKKEIKDGRSNQIEKLEIVDDFEEDTPEAATENDESKLRGDEEEGISVGPEEQSAADYDNENKEANGEVGVKSETIIKEEGSDEIKKEEEMGSEEMEKEGKVGSEAKEGTPGEKVEKKVTFADVEEEEQEPKNEPQESEAEKKSRSSTPIYRSQADGSIFEGPVQHVARNLIFLLDFDEEEKWGLTDMRIKTVLFGDDANLGASRRFQDLRTILKSSLRLDNPYAAPKEEKEEELLMPVTKITEESSMFEALRKLPRFGDKEIFEEEEEIENTEVNSEIKIRTEAPTGLYLPNGNKKVCLISGKEVRYFDPATGLPYGSKEVYQVIKAVELGVFPWYSIAKDQNTYGAVEIYLNKRDGSRHAKGVPEGFDGC